MNWKLFLYNVNNFKWDIVIGVILFSDFFQWFCFLWSSVISLRDECYCYFVFSSLWFGVFVVYLCVIRHLKKNASAFSVVVIATTFLSKHWLADISLFFCSEIMIEHPSTVVTILDNAIFWLDEHISRAKCEKNWNNHNKFHF